MMPFLQQPVAARRRPWRLALACAAGAGLLALAAGCQRPADSSAAKAAGTSEQATPKVEVTNPKRATVRREIRRPGYNIEAYQSTKAYAKISGYVRTWKFDLGDTVKRDEVMAELFVPEMEVEVQQREAAVVQAGAEIRQAGAAVLTAQAEYEHSKSQYERLQRVMKNGGVITEEQVNEFRFRFEASRAAVTKAQADVAVAEGKLQVAEKARDYAKTLLQYTRIPAPFAGVVTRRFVNEGDFVQPAAGQKGDPLFVVAQVDPVRVFVFVPDLEAVWVRDGAAATVRSQALQGREFRGKVTRNSMALDPTTRTLRTEIDLPNPKKELVPGMYVDVTITAERPGVWALPSAAVVTQEEKSFCYLLENGKAVRTPVQIGLRGNTQVEVQKNLVEVQKKWGRSAGPGQEGVWEDLTGREEVIVSGVSGLKDGQAVQVIPAGK
jgi:RND family efflux transporter MFP subunit